MLRLSKYFIACLVIGFCVVSCGGNSQSEADVLVFESNRDGDSEIFTMNPDGSNVRQLTNNDNFDGFPTWSPDGKKIYFVSDRDGSAQIFAMNPDGFSVIQITFDRKQSVGGPLVGYSWSTDGKTIGYWDIHDTGRNTFFVIEPDGTFIRDTYNAALGEFDYDVYWADDLSPDQREKYFSDFDEDGDLEIFVSEIDGSNVRQLTNNNQKDCCPRLSSDGQKIVFYSDRYGENEIFVMETNGANIISTTQKGKLASFQP